MAYVTSNITRNELATIDAPVGTRTWAPIPHSTLVDEVTNQCAMRGIQIGEEQHQIAKDGAQYFGQLQIINEGPIGESHWMLGLRNANDMAFAAAACMGEQVIVCSNLMFSGEVQFARKHTRHILRDLPAMVSDGLDKWVDAKVIQSERRETYKLTRATDRLVPQVLIRSMEDGVISSSQIGKVWQEWKTPRHEDFAERNIWSLQNAYTEVLKEVNQMTMPRRTVALTGLLDRVAAAA